MPIWKHPEKTGQGRLAMEKENTEGTGQEGTPEVEKKPEEKPEKTPEAPVHVGDDDLKISNTGQRVRAIIVVLIALGAAGAAIWYFNEKAKKEEAIQEVKTDFQVVHDNGYNAFWKETQVDIKALKSNEDFEVKIKEILANSSVGYARHIKDKALPILAAKLPDYKSLTAPTEFAVEVAAVATAAENLHNAWKEFAGEVEAYEVYLEAKSKLTDSGNAWLGIQGDPKDEEFLIKGANYLNLVRCILVDKIAFEIEPQDLQYRIEDTCAKNAEQAQWFRRVISDCMPKLLDKNTEADDYFNKTIEAYQKAAPGDTKSVFGVEHCLGLARDTFESEIINKIAAAWAEYVKAQNALLEKIKVEQKKLK